MALISKAIPGFYNGVSQQAAPLRIPTQLNEQINMLSNLVDGLKQRPNTEHLATLTSNALAGCFIHEINRDADEQYIMVITGDQDEPIEVYRLDTGAKCTIRYGTLIEEDTQERVSCTADNTTNTFTATAHGMEDGDALFFEENVPAEISLSQTYYIVNASTDTFQVSLTPGGTAESFTDDGSGMFYTLTFIEDTGVGAYFIEDSEDPNKVFKAITLADETYIVNTNVHPAMTGSTYPGNIKQRIQTVADLPGTPPSAGSITDISPDLGLSQETLLVEDEPGSWQTITGLVAAGHITLFMDWPMLTQCNDLFYRQPKETGVTKLEFQWQANGAGWTAPDVEFAIFTNNTNKPFTRTWQLPTGTGTFDVRVRRIGTEFSSDISPLDNFNCNWVGPALTQWETGEVIYEVTGAADSFQQSYYLRHDGAVWKEILRPGLEYQLSAASMPHKLVRTDTNEFTFTPVAWKDRRVSDDSGAPLPSFVDTKINNITFFKGRFGILAGPNLILSAANTFADFFVSSGTQVLDDDPIDVRATTGAVTPLRSAIVYDKDLVLLSDQQQYVLSSNDNPLTPGTAAITPTTRFEICRLCEPTAAGSNVYFVSPKRDYVAIREYMIMPDSLVTDAADITAHCPNYIPNGHLIIKALNAFDALFVWSDADPETLYFYKYYWLGNEKPQSSWSKWKFDGEILGIVTMDSYLTVATKRDNEVCLEKMFLENEKSGNLDWRVHLDRRTSLTGVYDSGANETTWTLPYAISLSETDMKVVDPDNGFFLPDVLVDTTSTLVKAGDWSSKEYLIGKEYEAYWEPSRWYVMDRNDKPVLEGRLQIRKLNISYTDTGYYQVQVTASNRSDSLVHEFHPARLSVSIINEMPLETGERSFLILGPSHNTQIRIYTKSYLPANFSTGAWVGTFNPKAKAI